MRIKVKSIFVFLALACLVVAIIIMILPYGVVMEWSPAPGENITPTYHSYFDFTPYAYGHFFPPITAIITVIATVFIMLYIFQNKFRATVLILTLIATICSVLVLFFPANITAISILTLILLTACTAFQTINYIIKKKK